jgi:hypothetical protein
MVAIVKIELTTIPVFANPDLQGKTAKQVSII